MIGRIIGRTRCWLILSVAFPFIIFGITCLIANHTTFEHMTAVFFVIL